MEKYRKFLIGLLGAGVILLIFFARYFSGSVVNGSKVFSASASDEKKGSGFLADESQIDSIREKEYSNPVQDIYDNMVLNDKMAEQLAAVYEAVLGSKEAPYMNYPAGYIDLSTGERDEILKEIQQLIQNGKGSTILEMIMPRPNFNYDPIQTGEPTDVTGTTWDAAAITVPEGEAQELPREPEESEAETTVVEGGLTTAETMVGNYVSGLDFSCYVDNFIGAINGEEESTFENKELCEHYNWGDYEHVSFEPYNEYAEVAACDIHGQFINYDRKLTIADSDLVDRLDKAGFQGLKEWMQKVEKSDEYRDYPSENKNYYYRLSDAIVINEVLFIYNEQEFSIRFYNPDCWMRAEYAHIIPEKIEDGWLVYTSQAGGIYDCLELQGPTNGYLSNEIAKQAKIYYQNGEMRQINLNFFSMNSYADTEPRKLFREREIPTIANFLKDWGVDEADAGKFLLDLDTSMTKKSGTLGGVKWTFRTSQGNYGRMGTMEFVRGNEK
ncbi:hypothetical protein [Anaerolentibacter hominis]|uniref:hypothetical protein n=1 Tax=Anaerolentibacter hominis TaxID=3079009 RepID=UPI0031B83ABA